MRLERRIHDQPLEQRLCLCHALLVIAVRRPDRAQLTDEFVEDGKPWVRHDCLPMKNRRCDAGRNSQSLFVQRLAFDSAAAKQAALLLRKIGPGMDGAAVIPHQKITELPHVLKDEFAPLTDVIKLVEDRIALLGAHALDAGRHQPIDEQCLAAGIGMRHENRMGVVRNAADIA